MLQVGDEVVIMSAPGRFTVIAIDGEIMTIENRDGVRKTILAQGARLIEKAQHI